MLGITYSTGDASVRSLVYMCFLHLSRVRIESPVMMWYTDEDAEEESGALGSTKLFCKSFKAFTVLLIGILALGARYTPEMYTIGVNPLSELLNAHVTSWWLSLLIKMSVLTFTEPVRTSSDTPPVLVSVRLPLLEGPHTVYIFHPASST